MHKRFDHKEIEEKWRKSWASSELYKTTDNSDKPKAYVLDMFPYPSGEGLHVGHPKGYIASDIYSRFKRMTGHEVLHPMGWDAFGLPAENYALKNKVHPRTAVEKNVARFKKQLEILGFDYDWSREINTTDPEYYKWTQWIFIQLFKKGLAYESFEPINWCPSCQTGLANEDLEADGTCERCGSQVEQKPMRQWVLKIREYADRMLGDLDSLDWPEHIKESQRNWIGRSEGAEIDFSLNTGKKKLRYIILHGYTATPKDNFYPWLKETLEAEGHEVIIPELPHSVKEGVPEEKNVEAALEGIAYDENTVLIGHSLGTVVALKVVEKLKSKINKLILVGGFMDPKFRDKERPFDKVYNWQFDVEKIKTNAPEIVALHDINDHAISDKQAEHLGKTLGIEVKRVSAEHGHFSGTPEVEVLRAAADMVTVFTTRPDTLCGATYMVLAPEHELVTKNKNDIKNWSEVEKYIKEASNKKEMDRLNDTKEKSGVLLEGITATNPVNGEEIPVYIADYVLASYGTGAIMAVPAHDERDNAFAKKFNIEIKPVIRKVFGEPLPDPVKRVAVGAFVRNPKTNKFLFVHSHEFKCCVNVFGGVKEGEEFKDAAMREVMEETGYKTKFVRYVGEEVESHFYHPGKKVNRHLISRVVLLDITDEKPVEIKDKELKKQAPEWHTLEEAKKHMQSERDQHDFAMLENETIFTGAGRLYNSGEFDGLTSDEAKKAITEKVGGKLTNTYKIRDWVFSRQRYWGEPIPIVHCEKCGAVPVPEEELPLTLPEVEHYEPSGDGQSPLANIEEWVNTKCPVCGEPAKRETNTMPQWAGSSWYYLRYMDPQNDNELVSKANEKFWAPVDVYVGGAEHATRHLIYARFWHKFLYDIEMVSTLEPFMNLHSVGLVMAEDGRKMSKRWGNVINPDDVVELVGADTLRVYEMFMGPFDNAIAWSKDGLAGARRFLERVYGLSEHIIKEEPKETLNLLHKTIKKVSDDIPEFKFNTAISAMMIFLNQAEKDGLSKESYDSFLRILAPFAPHLCEELFAEAGNSDSVHTAEFPAYDPELAKDEEITIGVQVNGKVRGEITIPPDATEENALEKVKNSEVLQAKLAGEEIKKVIYVPGRILNLIISKT